ncbi:hypothetical protein AMS68_007142 [Peltaster fructicola]|uniref:Mechanosensitive ion channel protein n=1 Tax=Peltaster fructicola TaxID=286661 RepID=A0A6H0Y3X1_9PEZI|nr:hypothetical protein AMS68_007142 [Peltaster fructicola]
MGTPFTDKAVHLDDLESGNSTIKTPRTTTIPVSSASERPILGRRQTTNELISMTRKGSHNDQDTLNKIGNFFYKVHSSSILVRYALYILPVGAVLAVPLALYATLPGWSDQPIANDPRGTTSMLGLFIWLEVIWVALWVCKLVAKTFPVLFQMTAGLLSAGVRKYAQVLKKLEIPISLLLWSITAWASTRLITRINNPTSPSVYWVDVPLNKAFKALIVVTAILLAEKTIIQLVSINYHRKQYEHKIKQSKKLILLLDLLYDASRRLFPEFCREFEVEDAEIQGNALQVRERLARVGLRSKFVNGIGRAGDKVTAAFGAMASDITGKQMFSSTSAHSVVIEALETQRASKALARRLWLSFVGVGKDALYPEDLEEVLGTTKQEEARAIFAALDCDGNGDVSLDEMTMLIVSAGTERKNRAKSMADIGEAIGVLDKLLSVIVLIAVGFVYAAFFSDTFASSTTQLWSTFTGLAFAIGGTVTEFLSCCIFLFVKHPYDVGDRVDIDKAELIVEHISLMYSVFRRIDSDKTVQIPHNVANTLWIENISRSRAQKERYTFNISAATSAKDIDTLRAELENFVRATENRRDFKENVDIHLISVGDLKQLELRVEIKYKSNFSNETLRQTRRNKFMCELLSAMRKVPIEPPGGSAPVLGDFKNPSYSVAISDVDAISARAKHAEDVASKRFVPPTLSTETMTSGFNNPVNNLVQTLTGRRASVTASSRTHRSSFESILHRQATIPQPYR